MKGTKNHFTETEDQHIIEVIKNLGLKEGIKQLSIELGRKRRIIKERYTNTLNPSLQPIFTEEEDIRLIEAVKNFGTSWKKIESIFSDKSQSQLKSRHLTLLRLIKRNKISEDGHRLSSYKDRKYNVRRAKGSQKTEQPSLDDISQEHENDDFMSGLFDCNDDNYFDEFVPSIYDI